MSGPDPALVQLARNAVLASDAVGGIRLVGVDGPAGSGKSTFAAELGAALGAPVVGLDWFMVWTSLESWWPRVQDQLIAPLLRGEDARYQLRDWPADEFGDSLGEWAVQPWAPVIVLEGVGSTRRETIGQLAYRVWVEAPDAVRLVRGLERDGESHRPQWDEWIRMEAEFFPRDGARDRADLIVATA